ncbi:AI-2E family transporter [Candidatus Parcubacteria bacterium]|nr:AI-2E family transporter [Candidatus Parcubacteria bacterium]
MAEQTLDISWQTIVKVLITGCILYMLFLARDIVIWFFFALMISLLLDPAINFLRWGRVPKILAVALVYISIFGILGLIIYLTAPVFMFELNQFSSNLPMYFEKINPILHEFGIEASKDFNDVTAILASNLKESAGSILKALTTFFGGISATMLIFALAFFISLEERGTERVLAFLAPRRYQENIMQLFQRAQYKVSMWFGARLLACVFVGITSLITFYILGVPYAFILALISGVLNFVPYIGPTVTMVLAVLFVGIADSWLVAGYVAVVLLVIQEIENKLLTPFLMKKFLDLPPVLVLLSLLVGGILFGLLGSIFAVPVFGIIYEFTKEFMEKRREEIIPS